MEEAANELIHMLLEFDNNQKEEGEKNEVESSTELEGMFKPIVVGMDLLEANIQFFKQAMYVVLVPFQVTVRFSWRVT